MFDIDKKEIKQIETEKSELNQNVYDMFKKHDPSKLPDKFTYESIICEVNERSLEDKSEMSETKPQKAST